MRDIFSYTIIVLVIISVSGTNFLLHEAQAVSTVTFLETFESDNSAYVDPTQYEWDTANSRLVLASSAAGKKWGKTDGSAPGYDTVANTTAGDRPGSGFEKGQFQSLKYDASGNPGAAWVEIPSGDSYGDVYFRKWNGTSWAMLGGDARIHEAVDITFGVLAVDLEFDENNYPVIVFIDKDSVSGFWDVFITRWNGSGWVKSNGSTAGIENITNNAEVEAATGTAPLDLDIDLATGDLYMAFMDNGSSEELRYAFYDDSTSTWSLESVHTLLDGAYNVQLTLDSSITPHIVWATHSGGTPNGIYYTYKTGGNWVEMGETTGYETIASGGTYASAAGTANSNYNFISYLGSDDKINIAWVDNGDGSGTDYNVYFVYDSGAASPSNYGGSSALTSYSSAYAVSLGMVRGNSDNYPRITWSSNNDGDYDIYFVQWDGTQWEKADGTTAGNENVTNSALNELNSYISLDSSGNPTLGYGVYWSGNYLGASMWNGTSWITDYEMQAGGNPAYMYYASVAKNPVTNEMGMFWYYSATAGNDWAFSGIADFPSSYSNPPADATAVGKYFAVPYGTATNIGNSVTVNLGGSAPAGTTISFLLAINNAEDFDTMRICAGFYTHAELNTSVTIDTSTNPACSGTTGGNSNNMVWAIEMHTTNTAVTPVIQYISVSFEGEINATNYPGSLSAQNPQDVSVSASIDPTISLALGSTSCSFGTFIAGQIDTCNYTITVSTNASNGYTAYIKDSGDFSTGGDTISDSDGTIADNSQEYGVATSETDAVAIAGFTGTCDDPETSPFTASALTTSSQSVATATDTVAADVTTVCHAASTNVTTPAGIYSNATTITVVGNF